MKKITYLILTLLSLFIFISCGNNDSNNDDIIIVYTNDIHSYIANTITNADKTETPGLRLSKLSAYVKKLKSENPNVLLVDAGDEIQGAVYGALDKGHSVIDIMNKVGYDLATPGNHDFDYGMEFFNQMVEQANYPFISCNFKRINNERVLDDCKIFEIGGLKIGFVGISTPETIIQSTPTFFQNENKEFIYKFEGQADKNDLYNCVQESVNMIRNDVDYVIALGHTGVGLDEERVGIRSIDIINNTTGIDAYIDAHSHTYIPMDLIKSKDNKDVVLTQTGCYLEHIGIMNISNSKIETKTIKDLTDVDNEVKELEDNLINTVNEKLSQKIAVLDKELYVNNSENINQRLIRARETNLGNFAPDSIYWYLNEDKQLDCDIAIVNGGGIRADLPSGDMTYLSAKTVNPFGNQVCLIKTTGKNIKNALEMGVTVCDEWDNEYDSPAENGGFLHVAGMKYTVDASIKSSVKVDSNKMFESVDGEYRVKDIMIYNKNTKSYEPLDENKEYTVGGINYILRNSGNGLSMFSDSKLVLDYIGEDYMVFANYMMAFTKESDNYAHINNNNSPLKNYENYLYDYENPLGSGRINIINLPKRDN